MEDPMNTYIARKTACEKCTAVSRTQAAVVTVSVVNPNTGDEQTLCTLCRRCWEDYKLDAEDGGHEIIVDSPF